MYDVVVVGGGPAGLSAAVQARTRNKSVLVVSGDVRDNPLWKARLVNNYLGMPGLSGREMLEAFQKHAREVGVEEINGRVLNIMPAGSLFYLGIGSQVEEARAVILATGVVRAAQLPGEAEYLGRGVSYCATCDGMLYRGKDVAVLGMAADAPEEANYLQELGCKVTYISDRQPEGLRKDIAFRKGFKRQVVGGQSVEAVEVDGERLPCAGVFILRPSLAPVQLLPGLALEGGYIAVDRNMATNLPGVFAAGDCTGAPLQVSKAVGEGLVAGHRAAEYIDQMDKS